MHVIYSNAKISSYKCKVRLNDTASILSRSLQKKKTLPSQLYNLFILVMSIVQTIKMVCFVTSKLAWIRAEYDNKRRVDWLNGEHTCNCVYSLNNWYWVGSRAQFN